MNNFKNALLILHFNDSDCVHNKDPLIKIYQKHFKKIIVYSNTPKAGQSPTLLDNVHYINTSNRCSCGDFCQRIFVHFYSTYKKDILECDGLFFTMDDNIINVNILNSYDPEKIIFSPRKGSPIESKGGNGNSGSHWDWDWGKKAILNLEKNLEYQNFGINEYCDATNSDFFYLPKQYLSKKLFDLFRLFGEYEVFHELAVPTIINHIGPNATKSKGGHYTFPQYAFQFRDIKRHYLHLWGDDRKQLESLNGLRKVFDIDRYLAVHPVKLNANPEAINWLKDIFLKDKITKNILK